MNTRLQPAAPPVRKPEETAVRTVAEFEIKYHQLLDPNGRLTGSLPEFARDPAELVRMYQLMSLVRTFDTKAVNLQRTGKLGTYATVTSRRLDGRCVKTIVLTSPIRFASHAAPKWLNAFATRAAAKSKAIVPSDATKAWTVSPSQRAFTTSWLDSSDSSRAVYSQ